MLNFMPHFYYRSRFVVALYTLCLTSYLDTHHTDLWDVVLFLVLASSSPVSQLDIRLVGVLPAGSVRTAAL